MSHVPRTPARGGDMMKRRAQLPARLVLWCLAACVAMPQAAGAASDPAKAPGPETSRSQPVVTREDVTSPADAAAPANTTSVESLPVAAQASISAALGRDDEQYHAETASGSVTLTNHDHQITTVFTRDGVTIQRRDAAPIGMALTTIGVGETLAPVTPATPVAATNRVEYVRGPLTEWYVNGPVGLEQGFTLDARPAQADGPLTLAMTLTGPGTPRLDGETNVVTWQDGLSYGGLFAVDAEGRELPASLALDGRTLRIEVDDEAAVYPIVIDPWLQQAKLTVGGPADAGVGTSVAVSGDTALVGAPRADTVYVFTRSGTVWSEEAAITPDGGTGILFGISVALLGDAAVVGAPNAAVAGNDRQGAAYVFTRNAGVWTQQAVLTASDGAEGDSFGYSVALEGDTALIGAWLADWGERAFRNRGAAYVFTGSGPDWSQQAKLVADDGFFQAHFGNAVALSGDGNIALVGAREDGANPITNRGAAYVYTRSGSAWTQQAKLLADDWARGDWFGGAVALSFAGDVALIGAFFADVDGNDRQGAAYVFAGSGASWNQQAKLVADDGAPGHRFGSSVALSDDGETALVGARVSPDVPAIPGATYVFTGSDGAWTPQGKLLASDATQGDEFGFSVALDGDTALMGAPGADAAYVFTGSGAVWTEQAKLGPSGAPNAVFGVSVDLKGDTALVGASGQEAAYLFTRSGAVWTEVATLTADDGVQGDDFGFSVALSVSGNTALVGAWTADWGEQASTNRGAAYVFTLSDDGTWSQQAKLTADDGWFQAQFGFDVALSGDGNIALVGAHNDGANQNQNRGAAYVYGRSGETWSQQAKLLAEDGARGAFFGESVDLSLAGDIALIGAARANVGDNAQQGAAYIFTGSGTTWTQQAKLVADDGTPGARFGLSSALSDDGGTALLGAPLRGPNAPDLPGAAYVFTGGGADWTQQAKLLASDGTAGNDFGVGVDLSFDGDTAVVGASTAHGTGAAYLFSRSGEVWTEGSTLTADDGAAGDALGRSVAFSDGTALVGAPSADVGGNTDQGAAYVFVLEDEAADCDGDGMSNEDELRYGLDPCNATDEDGPDGDPDGDGISNIDEINAEVPSHPRGFYVQHFAEGAVGDFFQTDVGFFNASREEAANVLVTVIPEAGHPAASQWYTVEPLTRVTVDLEAALAGQSTGASTRIESDQPIAGLRQMLWDDTSYGSALESGQPEAANTWYFGEGATYVFDVFHVIENENSVDANVTITYLRGQDQGPPVIQEVVVPAYTRQTVWANAVPGLESVEISAVITSDAPIVAERAMYLTGDGDRGFEAGQMSAGATALSTTWNIAEGATHYFDTFLFFGNPNDQEATVTVTFQLPAGQTITKQYVVPAQAKRTILIDGQQDPFLEDTAFAASVSSTVPIIVERAMWWGPTSASWYEAHASLGTTETGTVFGIGEAQSGGEAEEDTYVLVSNASDTPAPVRFTLIYDDGTTEEKTLEVGGSSRLTALITTEFPASEGRRFSILVESVDQVPITVEVSRYQSTDGLFGNAGGTAHATKIQ
ncbi:MAG: hypothetical protein GEV06_00675 [Luteitalea sp.]|nr:hypothetical protein [Luteitalea sp.]